MSTGWMADAWTSPPHTRIARAGLVVVALLRAELQAAAAYRAQLILGIFGWVVPLAFMVLWTGAAGGGGRRSADRCWAVHDVLRGRDRDYEYLFHCTSRLRPLQASALRGALCSTPAAASPAAVHNRTRYLTSAVQFSAYGHHRAGHRGAWGRRVNGP